MKLIEFKDFTFNYLHQKKSKALLNINADIDDGTVVGIIGRAGAGKSTLIKALNGLVPQVDIGYQDGDVIVDKMNTRDHEINQMARHVGIVLQNPEIQLFSLTVWDDVAFGPSNLGLPRDEVFRRVESALKELELETMTERSPNNLSGGEQQLLAIAGLLAMEPKVMAFDEPVSMLDPIGKELVMDAMSQITNKKGTTSIVTESGADIEAIAEVVDRLIALDNGKIILDGTPEEVFQSELVEQIGVGRPQVADLFMKLRERGIHCDTIPITLQKAHENLGDILRQAGVTKIERPASSSSLSQDSFGETVVDVKNLHHIYKGGVHALKGISFDIPKGQIVGIIGQNGSGKSTLARHLVGLLKPTNKDASIHVKGQDITSRKMRLIKIIKMINYVFQNPDDQLFAETIRDEVSFAPKMMDLPDDEIKRLTDEALKVFDLTEHQKRYIYGLDEDLKTYLAITCILPLEPDILLIDEPTTGLDTQGEIKMMESLKKLRDDLGKTIVIITHNMKTVGNHCDRVLVMSNGNLILDGTPREVYAQDEKLLEADIRPPQITRLGQYLSTEFGCPRDMLSVDEMVDILHYNINEAAGGKQS